MCHPVNHNRVLIFRYLLNTYLLNSICLTFLQMFKDLTKEVPPIMNVLNIHENLLEALLEMGNYADVQGWDSMLL